MDRNLRVRARVLLLGFLILFSFFLVASKITFIASKEIDLSKKSINKGKGKSRLNITDRNGNILATNLSSSSAYVHPQEVENKEVLAEELNVVFPDLDKSELVKKFNSGKKFVWIKKLISPETERKLFDLGQPGLYFGHRTYRFYPKQNLASHVLGYTKINGEGVGYSHLTGISGAEAAFEKMLTASDPKKIVSQLMLSIDLSVQAHVENVLEEWIKRMNAKAGGVIIMDIRSGEIMAMASSPDYNPNAKRKVNRDLADPSIYFNRVIQGVYEMGSTFKIFSVAQGLEEGIFDLDSLIDTEPFFINSKKFKDSYRFDSKSTVREIIVRSSNVGSANMALQVGKKSQKKILKSLGLLDPVPLELREATSTKPILPPNWKPIYLATVSYGHGISVSLLHLAKAYSILTNGGLDVTPTILRSNKKKIGNRILRRETSRKIVELLESVVTEKRGTGRAANSIYYRIGGKTGTADKPKLNGKGYSENKVIANFAGVFPIEEPKYAIVAFLDEPENKFSKKNCRFSGCTVAPMVKQIINRVGPLLNVLPSKLVAKIN